MNKFILIMPICFLLLFLPSIHAESAINLLQNPGFEFHAFNNHRLGEKISYKSHNAAFWNTREWGDITVMRESHVDTSIRPLFSTHNMVYIAPGKKIWQFFTLPEAGLAHGDKISFSVHAYQKKAGAVNACLKILKLDSEDGTWSPGDFGFKRRQTGKLDSRTFSKMSRGDLVAAHAESVCSQKKGTVLLKIENTKIPGFFWRTKKSFSKHINTVGLRVEFENKSDDTVWIYSPALNKGKPALTGYFPGRKMIPLYRHIPRTIQKLWKGEPIHVIVMGSSIDRGSANPPMYLYDEDPDSPGFKQPVSEKSRNLFEGEKIGRPELDDYIGWWQHYFSYAGQLRLELMRKFNLPVNKICLNYMAADGSCIGESHSALSEYCSLAIPPGENENGHKKGKTWQELYPELFTRARGPGPDLVIFGSGANEGTDTPDEAAVFEGAIRWIQRNYPHTEFLFSILQMEGNMTSNSGDLQALSLQYGIPFLDHGKALDDLTRWSNRHALTPDWCHPAQQGHYLWFKNIEKAFECWDPIVPGQPQKQLPERMHVNTYAWEGDIISFLEGDSRLKNNKFMFEDMAVNGWTQAGDKKCWNSSDDPDIPAVYVDGRKMEFGSYPCESGWDFRNSHFRFGNFSFGDRHILEIAGKKKSTITRVNAKVCPDRHFLGIDNKQWQIRNGKKEKFFSNWGSPFGNTRIILEPGESIEIQTVCTDISVAYMDMVNGGNMRVIIDGREKLVQPANIPFVDIEKNNHFMENRRGILNLGFGLHLIKIEAV
ncbi:MAG: hypothetical protein ABIA63_12785, partial [bacterium]